MTTYHVRIGIGIDYIIKSTTSRRKAQQWADETDDLAIVSKFVRYDEPMPIVHMNRTAMGMHESGERRFGNLHLGEW